MNVYADHAATTPMRACAKEAMLEALEDFGNPSSIHSAGRLAAIEAVAASAWRVMTANRNVPPDAATGVILLSVQRGIQTAAGKSGHMNMEEIGLDRSGK